VFSTWLYTGTGATQTITNNIDLSTKGGLVWTKSRTNPSGTYDGWHALVDTARGTNSVLYSNATDSYSALNTYVSAFNTNGFNLGAGTYDSNKSSYTYVSWTFRKQPKFFDVVTYTGNGSAPRAISHSLGSTPGCIIIKKTSSTGNWWTFHRSAPNQGVAYPNIGGNLYLDATDAADSGANPFLSAVDSTTFTLSTNQNSVMNASGATYVAYLFAHNAGGFGLTGTDNVITCGSFTTNGSGAATVNLGYEPQWLLLKNASVAQDWWLLDTMRGWPNGTGDKVLSPNLSDAESNYGTLADPTATGFNVMGVASSRTYIYIAIRRGPMKVPTDATKVFTVGARAGTSAVATVNAGFPQDSWLVKNRDGNADTVDWSFNFFDRLRSSTGYRLSTAFTDGEDTSINFITSYNQNSITLPSTGYTATNGSGYNYIDYFLRRAPSFFDEVCYTGTGSAATINHNLGAVPDLIIVKARSNAVDWVVGVQALTTDKVLVLNTTAAPVTVTGYFGTSWPTSTAINYSSSGFGGNNASGITYVAYLFATCAGVSKVGTYTGNGTTQAIACGFTGGARFVLIKRTDSTGGWYVYDTARGMTTLTDPYLFLNSTAAETATLGSVTTTTGGFTLNESILTGINTSSATYIFLAIA
jgi:hypothetical protein